MKTIIRPKQLFKKVGLSRSTIWRLERQNKFPRHIKLSAQAIGWDEAEIDSWLKERTTASVAADRKLTHLRVLC